MDFTNETHDGGEEDELFFVGDSCGSEGEGEIELSDREHSNSCNPAARLSGESSPPLLLAFSVTSGPAVHDSSPSPTSSPAAQQQQQQEEEDEDSDISIEEWMLLGGGEEVGDSNIQLNLGYWSSSEDDSGDEDRNAKSIEDIWAVSEKDKYSADQSSSNRYFVPDRSLICQICNRTGHPATRCYYHKKYPNCILCGIQGHVQRNCPGRPCTSCGLPSHGLEPCEKPPVWKQHCQRCGMTGHLSDVCPDTWRQYHFTIQLDLPIRPQTVHNHKHKRYQAHCYNCSKRGHFGYECTKKRMISGTFPSLPYVCQYDTKEGILQRCTRIQKRAKELTNAGSLPPSDEQRSTEPTSESGEENQPAHGRSKTKQEAFRRAGRRKTWPERRRERREVKRLRREAQARREGGMLGKSRGNSDDEVCPTDLLKYSLHGYGASTPPPQKKRDEAGDRRSRKSREAERWKKRRGLKRGDLYPHGDLDIGSENLLSPKQRVRHRRR